MNENALVSRGPAALLGESEESSFDASQILTVLREKLWLIVLFGLLAVFAGFAYAKSMPRTFLATTVVEVNSQPVRVVQYQDTGPSGLDLTEMSDAIVAVFKNRTFLQHVAEENDLLNEPDFFSKSSTGPWTTEAVVQELARLQAVQVRKGSPFIDVSFQHPNPRIAQKISNALAEGYIRHTMRQRAASSEMAIDFLKDEAKRLKNKVQSSEQALQDYIRKTGSMSLRETQDTVMAKLKSLSGQLLDAKAVRIRLEADEEEIRKNIGNPEAMLDIASVASHPSIAAAKEQITGIETMIDGLALRYTEKHPKMIQARLQLANAKTLLKERLAQMPALIRSHYEGALTTERKFEAALKDQEVVALNLSDQAITYNVLTRDVDTDRALYDSILKRLKETEIAKGIEFNNVHIFEPAMMPGEPMQPPKFKVLAAALAIGLCLGIGVSFGLNALDSSLKTVEEAEQVTRLKVIGAIPRGSRREVAEEPLSLYLSPASSVAESFRSLRTSIYLADRSRNHQVVLLTSANPGEGKTFCTINYALSVAQQGLRTLIIDADLRMPMIEKLMLPSESNPGLTDYLANGMGGEITVCATEVDNLFVLPAGIPVPNPAEMLSSPALGQLIDACRKDYQCIVIDTAPVLPVSDTMLLLEHADSICLVAYAGKTPRKQVLRAAQLLTQAAGRFPNLIMNRLSPPKAIGAYLDKYGRPRAYGAPGSRPAPAVTDSADSLYPPAQA